MFRSVNSGVPWSAKSFSFVIVRRTWWRVAGNFRSPSSRSALRSAVAWPEIAALRKKPVMCVRSRASGASTASPLLARLASCWFCCGEDRQDAVGLAQRRVGPVDHLAEVLAAAGEAGAEAR